MSELRMKSFKELLEKMDIDAASRYYPYRCQNCGRVIPFFSAKIKHCNVTQKPSIKFFCSKECRDRWTLELRINNDPALNKNEMKIYG